MRPVILLAGLGIVLGGATGCVSYSSYEMARRDAENTRLLYQNETRRAVELAEQNKKMKLQIEDMEARVRNATETADRASKEYKIVRDELLAIKMQSEQERHQAKDRLKRATRQLEKERAVLETEAELQARSPAVSEQTRERVRALLQEVQTLLEQVEKQ
jgi:hypothetical protein